MIPPLLLAASLLTGYPNSLAVPCQIGGHEAACALDTGSSLGLDIGYPLAHVYGLRCEGTATVESTTGTAAACTILTTLTIAGRTVTITGIAERYSWIPLIGLPALRALFPDGFTVNFKDGKLVPLR